MGKTGVFQVFERCPSQPDGSDGLQLSPASFALKKM